MNKQFMSSNFQLYLTNVLAYITQDIRTQMNSILKMCYLIKESTNESQTRDRVEVIETSVESLSKEINDYLELSKQEITDFQKSLETLDNPSLDFLTGIYI